MDFPKSCSTGAVAVVGGNEVFNRAVELTISQDGFAQVPFRVYAVYPALHKEKYIVTEVDNAKDEDQACQALLSVEAELRKDGFLVTSSRVKMQLWVFRLSAAQMDKLRPGKDGEVVISGARLKGLGSGIFHSSQLRDGPQMTVSVPKTSSNNTTNDPASGIQATQAYNAGAAQANSLIDGALATPNALLNSSAKAFANSASSQIYSLLLASIASSLTFFHGASGSVVPLNACTLLSLPVSQHGADDLGITSVESSNFPLRLSTIDIRLTSAGLLILSSSQGNGSPLQPLPKRFSTTHGSAFTTREKLVRVAPSGKIAKVVDNCYIDESQLHGAQRPQGGKRQQVERYSIVTEELRRRKRAVVSWLESRGISSSFLKPQTNWVTLMFPSLDGTAKARYSEAGSNASHFICPWPAALCFCIRQQSLGADTGSLKCEDACYHVKVHQDGLRWFKTKDQEGFRDPLSVAQLWFMGKADRELEAETLHLARQQQQEVVEDQNPQDLLPFDFSSPAEVGNSAVHDFQTASGMYPTPPEGLVSQASTGAAHQDAWVATSSVPSLNQTSGTLAGDFQDLAINSMTAEFALGSDDPLGRKEDDLFDDMDEDIFDETGVTDADFSFFDEPETPHANANGPSPREILGTSHQGEVLEKEDRRGAENDIENLGSTFPTVSALDATEMSDDPGRTTNHAMEHGARGQEGKQRRDHLHESLNQEPATDESESVPGKLLHVQTGTISIGVQTSPSKKSIGQVTGNASNTSLDYRTERKSLFAPVEFDDLPTEVDMKYAQHGRYGPTVAIKPSLKDRSITTLLSARPYDTQDSSDSEETNVTSSEQAFSQTAGDAMCSDAELLSEPTSTLKRKRGIDDYDATDEEVSAAPYNRLKFAEHRKAFGIGQNIYENLCSVGPDGADQPLQDPAMFMRTHQYQVGVQEFAQDSYLDSAGSCACLDNNSGFGIRDEDLCNIAIILMDQIVSSTMLRAGTEWNPKFSHAQSGIDDDTHDLNASANTLALQKVAKHLFPEARDCPLLELAKMSELHEDGRLGKLQPRPNPRRMATGSMADGVQDSSVSQLAAPNIKVQRGASRWEMLPSALPFWDSLALGPCSGPKDVNAYCVYPFSNDVDDVISEFLESIGAAYENGKFGEHRRGSTAGRFENGLVPVKLQGAATLENALCAIRETCVELGSKLAGGCNSDERTIVIYLVDPFEDGIALKYLCAAFWSLYEEYSQGLQPSTSLRRRADLVLQILPIDSIATFDAPVVLAPSVLAQLAREVYDRCPPNLSVLAKASLAIPIAAAVELGEPPPKTIPFRLIAEPSADLLHENSCLHVAYAASPDERWITAAWTDNYGQYQATVCYCMVGGRTFEEIAKEIWETTLDIIKSRRVLWQLFIASAGVMERDKMEVWTKLAVATTQPSCSVTLLAVNANPPLALGPPASNQSLPAASAMAGIYSTPALTPQPNSSPSHNINPPTPANAATPTTTTDTSLDPPDPDATLLDITDETWAVMLSHRLNNSKTFTDYNPALASAYMVRRNGIHPHARPTCIAVNVIWCGNGGGGGGVGGVGGKSAEGVLREVLGMFRGLGVLARVKGVESEMGRGLPWHVAAVRKGAEALGRLM